MRRRIVWTVVWSMILALAAMAALQPKPDRAVAPQGVDRATMDTGYCDAGAIMARINQQISLNVR